MFTGASRRRRPAPHARRSRDAAREGVRFQGGSRSWDGRGDRNVAREGVCFRGGSRSWDGRGDGNVAREGALSPCAARPDKGRANPAHGVRRGLPRRHATRRCGIYLGIARHRARMDIFHLSPNGTRRGLHRGFPGGFPGAFPGLSRGTFPRAFPGAWRAEMRRLSQTRPVNSRTDVLRLSPHRARRGLHRRHATQRCGIYLGIARHRARMDIFHLSPNGTRRGLHRGFPGGFPGAFPGLSRGTFPRAFPGAWRAEMRRLSQTRPVNSRTDFLRLSPHGARRGHHQSVCHAEMRHLSRHSPSTRPVRFSVCRRTGHGGGFSGWLSPGLSPGLSRGFPEGFPGAFPGDFSGGFSRGFPGGFSGGLFRGTFPGAFPGAFPEGFSRGLFPGLSGGFPGGLARGNAASIPTRPVSASGQTFLSLYNANPPHRARRGLCRRLGAKKRSLSPTQPVTAPGQTFSVCHRKPAARHVPREGWCSSSPSALPRRRARQILNTQEVSP